MQATTTTDFNCLPTDVIAIIASNSGRVWRSLVLVNRICRDTLNNWGAFVKQFTTVGVLTKIVLFGDANHRTIYTINDPERTSITLLDGVPHSEEGETWSMEPCTGFMVEGGGVHADVHMFQDAVSGTYRHGKNKRDSQWPTLDIVAWEVRKQ
jgi:hypothetical protein